jgi:hypothetical protein
VRYTYYAYQEMTAIPLVHAISGLHDGDAFRQTFGDEQTAERKAYDLLMGKLTAAQSRCMTKFGHFWALAPSGRRYRIGPSTLSYIDDEGKNVNLCVNLQDAVPRYDRMLALKMYVESNEAELLRKANKF